jgi:hypothetical protein
MKRIIPPSVRLREIANSIRDLSVWIDEANAARDPEAVTWGRLSKIGEEFGEVVGAWIGVTGQNPRKGVHGSIEAVKKELLDVAVTALGALEHLNGNDGKSMYALYEHTIYLDERRKAL